MTGFAGFGRTDTSILGNWWWTVDRWTLGAVAVLVGAGVLLSLAASPPVAEDLGLGRYHFVRRHLMYLPMVAVAMVALSTLTPTWVRRAGTIGFLVALALTAATLVVGYQVKGASRWIPLGGFTLQPAEILKPTFAVAVAWLLTAWRDGRLPHGGWITTGLMALCAALLLSQPDVGQTGLMGVIWFSEFFLAGLSVHGVLAIVLAGLGGLGLLYYSMPHVHERIATFIDPANGLPYQVQTAVRAFGDGGLFGVGPGEGRVKEVLPDAHTDFIFAVAGEEFGLVACLLLVGVYAFIVVRGFQRLQREHDLFILLAAGGLLVQFGVQAAINMASTVALMPPKGMTLPFVSYGGSSMLGMAVTMGFLLALTRRRSGEQPGRMP